MYSDKSYRLTEEEHNYLLPALNKRLLNSGDNYHFIGSPDDLTDMLNRLKGLYGYFDDLNEMIGYRCFKYGSLDPFRKELEVPA
jgi:hypothetical protein